jgi:hypothetical protein
MSSFSPQLVAFAVWHQFMTCLHMDASVLSGLASWRVIWCIRSVGTLLSDHGVVASSEFVSLRRVTLAGRTGHSRPERVRHPAAGAVFTGSRVKSGEDIAGPDELFFSPSNHTN